MNTFGCTTLCPVQRPSLSIRGRSTYDYHPQSVMMLPSQRKCYLEPDEGGQRWHGWLPLPCCARCLYRRGTGPARSTLPLPSLAPDNGQDSVVSGPLDWTPGAGISGRQGTQRGPAPRPQDCQHLPVFSPSRKEHRQCHHRSHQRGASSYPSHPYRGSLLHTSAPRHGWIRCGQWQRQLLSRHMSCSISGISSL